MLPLELLAAKPVELRPHQLHVDQLHRRLGAAARRPRPLGVRLTLRFGRQRRTGLDELKPPVRAQSILDTRQLLGERPQLGLRRRRNTRRARQARWRVVAVAGRRLHLGWRAEGGEGGEGAEGGEGSREARRGGLV